MGSVPLVSSYVPATSAGWGRLLLLVTVLFWGAGLPVHAQPTDGDQLQRFRTADAHLQNGKVESAIKILESLHESAPDNSAFYRKLKDAYEQAKRYDDALRLVEKRLEAGAVTPSLLAEKGRLQYRKGAEAKAEETWSQALSLAPDRPSTYRTVYQTLIDIRHFKRAIEVLRRARERIDDDTLFRTELGYLYGLDGQHKNAMREYVALLNKAPERLSLVRNRLQTFIDQNEGTSASIDVLQSAVEDAPLNTAYRELLAWLYMKTDDYAAAYEVYRALDRLQQKKGRALFTFAQKAMDADEYEVATRALEHLLDRHEEAEVAPQALRTLGTAYRQWSDDAGETPSDSTSHYDAARDAYQTFLKRHPNHEARPAVLAELGTLQLDVYRSLDTARATLERVVSTAPDTDAANQARYDLGRISLLEGDFDRARLLFSRLAERLRGGDLANQARFELALLQFYQGQFDAALTRANTVSADPSADVANDAIELRVLIQENRGPDSLDTALRQYAGARLQLRRHQYVAAATELDTLLQQHPSHGLADDARFQRADALLAQGDTMQATSTYRTLVRRHPRSPYADRSLFRLGELLEQRGQYDSAQKTYDRLLSEYPNSLLSSDARTRLRALRTRS